MRTGGRNQEDGVCVGGGVEGGLREGEGGRKHRMIWTLSAVATKGAARKRELNGEKTQQRGCHTALSCLLRPPRQEVSTNTAARVRKQTAGDLAVSDLVNFPASTLASRKRRQFEVVFPEM